MDSVTPKEASLIELVAQIPRLVEPGKPAHNDNEKPVVDNDDPKKEKKIVDTPKGTLRFTRHNRYAGMFIGMSIYINDVMVGKVGNDQSADFTLTAGQHFLQVKGGLAFSTDRELVQIQPNETQRWTGEFTLWNTIKLRRV